MANERPYSSIVVDGVEQAPSRAMLYPTGGFKPEDFSKPQIGIASTWSMVTPCNMHINELAEAGHGRGRGRRQVCAFQHHYRFRRHFHGHTGHALFAGLSGVIADSIETVVGAQGFDGFVAIGGCDKNMPACGIAMARMDRPSVFVYGGTILPGKERRDIVSVFEAVGGHAAGTVSDIELKDVWKPQQFPARVPAVACIPLIPWHHPWRFPAFHCPAVQRKTRSVKTKNRTATSADWRSSAQLDQTGHQTQRWFELPQASENAITLTIALEGSTNAVLHLLAIAHAANIPLSIDALSRVGKRNGRVFADMRPAGVYAVSEPVEIWRHFAPDGNASARRLIAR